MDFGGVVAEGFSRHVKYRSAPFSRQPLASRLRKAKRIVKSTVGTQTGVRGHDQTAKLEHQPSVEIEPERLAIRFTRRVRHDMSFQISLTRWLL